MPRPEFEAPAATCLPEVYRWHTLQPLGQRVPLDRSYRPSKGRTVGGQAKRSAALRTYAGKMRRIPFRIGGTSAAVGEYGSVRDRRERVKGRVLFTARTRVWTTDALE